MAAFDKLTKAFEQGKDQGTSSPPKTTGLDVVKQSLAIVHAIDKLKAQGIEVTKKAELDYLLALRVLERADIDPEQLPEAEPTPIKRTPKDNPKEFQIAMAYSQKIVGEVENMQKQGQPVPENKLADYSICKKFLKKYS